METSSSVESKNTRIYRVIDRAKQVEAAREVVEKKEPREKLQRHTAYQGPRFKLGSEESISQKAA